MIRRWKIGPVDIENPFVLAPMAGITDLPFRGLCREQGAGLVYTEMVSAKAISYRNRNTLPLMEISPGEHPAALQIFGSEPELMAEVARSIEEQPFDILDINMGCPVPKVVNNGEGSALLKNPALIREIVTAVSGAVKKPVTVKIRIGFEGASVDPVEIAKIIEDSGAAALAVHGRTRQQYYSGHADWETIRKIKEAVSIPVMGNGDVDSPKKAEAMLKETGCDAVMIGRAARGNPWIFREMNHYFQTGELLPRPSLEELKEMILRHTRWQIEKKGEYTGIREMRKHVAWYTAGMRHSAGIRRESNLISSYQELEALLERLSAQENKM
ncbi:MAG TPA: tRNA dihydrouridine synthase DusB [Candidatus Blautia excrementipullorum]|nr:tRNA dihydrouridine synthase DusB [Candidatus Blautia excrementipullorum]